MRWTSCTMARHDSVAMGNVSHFGAPKINRKMLFFSHASNLEFSPAALGLPAAPEKVSK